MSLTRFTISISVGPYDCRSRLICETLVEGIMGNTPVNVFSIKNSSSGDIDS